MIPEGALGLAEFRAAAAAFAATLRAGDAVRLEGPLGAGKTTFVRAVVAALHGDDDDVSSPTFVVRQRYEGEPPVEHLDLYRIEDPAEVPDLALDDAFGPDRITLVEWAERAPGWIPDDAIVVRIDGAGDAPRRIDVRRP